MHKQTYVFDFAKFSYGFGKFMTLKSIQSSHTLTFHLDIEVLEIKLVDNKDIYHICHPLQIQKVLSSMAGNNFKHSSLTESAEDYEQNQDLMNAQISSLSSLHHQ